jgi:hypothetical protein
MRRTVQMMTFEWIVSPHAEALVAGEGEDWASRR